MKDDTEISTISYWLDNCEKNHLDCTIRDPNFMPTRVVDVGTGENRKPRLLLTANLNLSDRRYLALSHCWGLAMPLTSKSTLATIADRLEEIPLAGLTRTFTDFISIAWRMHIRYVWMDSLCIIQDSKDDWEKEAAQMASVYSNAYCTIAASSSASGNEGCRVDPDSEPYGPVILSFNEANENSNPIIRKVRIFSTLKSITDILQRDVLSGRGWTFQERELSNRILHYSKDSIRWECRGLKASLQFPWQDTNAFNGNLRTFDTGQIRPRTAADQESLEKQKEREEAWFEAVLKYTGRSLTYPSDVLHAFSGIARTVQSCTDDRYLAGLWYSNLIHCLCWASAWSQPITHKRQPEYLAPSWSWACIAGQIRYEWWIFHALDPTPSPRALSFMPRILEATTIPADLDEYGRLAGGTIRLVGKIKAAVTCGEGFARQDREGVYDVHDGTKREIGQIRYDIPSEAPPGQLQAILCLCVLPRADRHGDAVGLALLPKVKGSDALRRVGLVFAIQLSWYETAVDREITLI